MLLAGAQYNLNKYITHFVTPLKSWNTIRWHTKNVFYTRIIYLDCCNILSNSKISETHSFFNLKNTVPPNIFPQNADTHQIYFGILPVCTIFMSPPQHGALADGTLPDQISPAISLKGTTVIPLLRTCLLSPA
jgi:hypothetical protein